MKRILSILFMSVSAIGLYGQSLEWNDQLKETGGGFSAILTSKVDANNNIYVGGNFSASVDFDPDDNSSKIFNPLGGSQDLFFGKYNENGELLYVGQLDASDWSSLSGIDYDVSGNYYITGQFRDTIDMDPSSGQSLYVTPSGDEHSFIGKYGSNGSFTWVKQIVSSTHVWSEGIARDNNGNIYIAGVTLGTTDFDPSSGSANVSSSDDHIFVAKYNSSGNYVNVISMGVSGSDQKVFGIETDGSGNVYVYGLLRGTVDFDPGSGTASLSPKGNSDYFIAKYNSSLQYQWAYTLGGSSNEDDAIRVKIAGNSMIVAASYLGTVDANLGAGTQNYSSNGSYDMLLARYDLSAGLQSSSSIGGSGDDLIRGIAYYSSDSIYFTGQFSGTVNFDPSGSQFLTATASLTVFFAGYSQNFDYRFASVISGTGSIWSTGIDNMGPNPVVLGRQVSGFADFNGAWNVSDIYSGPAAFFAKYGKCGELNINASTTDSECGKTTGSATVTVQGGSGPYTYRWTSGDTSDTADSLRSGSYYVTVTESSKGCVSESDPILINDLNGPIVSVQTKVNVSCVGDSNGAIVLNVSGGTSPYSYSWSNGSTNKNINALRAGIYEVTVTDNDGCKSSQRIEITEPTPLSVTTISSEPSCGNSDGVLTAIASGGASPYSYSWNPGGSGSTQFNLGVGVYRVTVTDANNCTYTEAIPLSEENAPSVSLDALIGASCGSGGGSISISVSGGTPSYSYSWSNGSSAQDLTGLQPGEYDLIVTDQQPCKAAFTAEVEALKGVAPEICMIDVDLATGNAQVLWEKPTSAGVISRYSIYRETSQRDVFDLVTDTISFGTLSLFMDRYANTWVRAWSYKLAYTDTCGVISELSKPHTTIHTVVTRNPQGKHNVLWTEYEGDFPISTYDCFRFTNASGEVYMDSFPAGKVSWVDTASINSSNDLYYYISVRHPNKCTATEAVSKNSARSNRGSIAPPNFGDTLDGLDEVQMELAEYQVYPNPNNGVFNLNVNSTYAGIISLQLLDVQGHVLIKERKMLHAGQNSIIFDTGNVPEGMYLLQLDLNNERAYARVAIVRGD